MDYECLRPKCRYTWSSKIRHSTKKPKCCPKCHSHKWNDVIPAKVNACTICSKPFKKGAEVYRLVGGTNNNGTFIPGKEYGDYCDVCCPGEEDLPWST